MRQPDVEAIITVITIGDVSDRDKLIPLANEKYVELITLDKPEDYEKKLSEMSNNLTEMVNNLTEQYRPPERVEIVYVFFILVEEDIKDVAVVIEAIQNRVNPDVVSIITPKGSCDNKCPKYANSYIEVSKENSVSEVALEITNLITKPGLYPIHFAFPSDLRLSLWNKKKMKAAIVSAKKENYLEGVDAAIEKLALGKEALSKCDKFFFSISSRDALEQLDYINTIPDYIYDKLDDNTFGQYGTSECPELTDDEVRIMIICDAD